MAWEISMSRFHVSIPPLNIRSIQTPDHSSRGRRRHPLIKMCPVAGCGGGGSASGNKSETAKRVGIASQEICRLITMPMVADKAVTRAAYPRSCNCLVLAQCLPNACLLLHSVLGRTVRVAFTALMPSPSHYGICTRPSLFPVDARRTRIKCN